MCNIVFSAIITWAFMAVACNKESAANPPTAAMPGAPAAPTAPVGTENAAAAAAPAAGDKQYRIEAAQVRLKVGAAAAARMVIKPGPGLHFNAEYPAKFTVAAAAFAKAAKEKLTSKDGDVKVDGETGVVTVPLQGLAAGAGALVITGSFSVCNDEQCYILRDEKLTLQVTVQ
ncbi:MAG: hypothetical protein EXR77_04575 [Myxococcales bacterium]|nr:hypothetical protein [Myxococcales bacterium]